MSNDRTVVRVECIRMNRVLQVGRQVRGHQKNVQERGRTVELKTGGSLRIQEEEIVMRNPFNERVDVMKTIRAVFQNV